jgi:transcriptional regulator with XRE-family HTH domain
VENNEDIFFLKVFGQNVRKIRKDKGLTQEQLSNDLGMEISQISRIERGVVNTSILNITKIAQVLEIDIEELFKF